VLIDVPLQDEKGIGKEEKGAKRAASATLLANKHCPQASV